MLKSRANMAKRLQWCLSNLRLHEKKKICDQTPIIGQPF